MCDWYTTLGVFVSITVGDLGLGGGVQPRGTSFPLVWDGEPIKRALRVNDDNSSEISEEKRCGRFSQS
jgi:hypothetical protein